MYVKLCASRRKMSLIAQLRIGILPFYVEIRRFCNVKLEDRVCQISNNRQIEDEFQFVCI